MAKKAAKKTTKKKTSRAIGYTTKIMRGIANADVPDVVAIEMAKPKYVSHNLLPEGNGKTTIIFIFRR